MIGIKLEDECWRCSGTGEHNGEKCDHCEGVGWNPSEAGMVLLKFMRKYKDIEVSE